MSESSSRRSFLSEVGQGMLAVLAGPALTAELALAPALAADAKDAPAPAGLDALTALLLETPPDKLPAAVKDRLDRGVSLKSLAAAGCLANARAFAGQHYDGYHTFMAIAPALGMCDEMKGVEKPLPLVKVLSRNSRLLSSEGRLGKDTLGTAEPHDGKNPAGTLLAATRARKVDEADRVAAAMAEGGKYDDAFDAIQPVVHDDLNVHRVVLAWRCREVLAFTGKDHARTMLRQTVRFCADNNPRNPAWVATIEAFRKTLAGLMEKHKLLDGKPGKRVADDAWVERLSKTVRDGKQADAAGAVAAALADGIAPDGISEAIALACSDMVLWDKGQGSARKPAGSVHGDSVGVHASDAANAWRHIAAVTTPRHTFASLISSAYHTAGQAGNRMASPYGSKEEAESVKESTAADLLAALAEAVKGRDQRRAAAVARKYAEAGHGEAAVFAQALKVAVSEDGALHAEKYYGTVREEVARSRKAFRGTHLVALARVTASTAGKPAPGLEEARRVLTAKG